MTAGSLAHARTCYAHLAGWLGVEIAKELEHRGMLRVSGPKHYTVTAPGRIWFKSLGMDFRMTSAPPTSLLDAASIGPNAGTTLPALSVARCTSVSWSPGG